MVKPVCNYESTMMFIDQTISEPSSSPNIEFEHAHLALDLLSLRILLQRTWTAWPFTVQHTSHAHVPDICEVHVRTLSTGTRMNTRQPSDIADALRETYSPVTEGRFKFY
jgi:hypothetical protein